MELGLGWLRAVAQGYNYSYNKMKLGSTFKHNLKSWNITFGWGFGLLRAVAQGNKIQLGNNCQWNFDEFFGIKLDRGLYGCARWRKVTQVQMQYN